MARPHILTAALVAMALASSATTVAAQDGGGSREREALRRTQAALRQAQEQQAALAKDKSDLSAERDKLDEAAKRSQSQLSSARADGARLNSELARVSDELTATKAKDEADRQAAQARIDELSARLARAERIADERTRSNLALTGLLEHATQSLAMAEKANRDMHAFGLQLIDRVRGRSVIDGSIPIDPVLGFGSVRLENEAEGLRDQLDAFKLANVARRAAAGAAAN